MEKDSSIHLSAAHFTPFMCGMGEILSPKWVQTMPIIGPQNAQYCAQNTRQNMPEIPILSNNFLIYGLRIVSCCTKERTSAIIGIVENERTTSTTKLLLYWLG